MDLRPPPAPPPPAPKKPTALIALQAATLALIAAGFLWFGQRTSGSTEKATSPERLRQVASKLKAAGALDEAATLYAEYLRDPSVPTATRAQVAYSLGQTYMEGGHYERALRWFYEVEGLGAKGLAGAVGEKIVHCLERLGRVQAAQAALAARVNLDPSAPDGEVQRATADPIVAKIGVDEIRQSDVLRALDDLPPEMRKQMGGDQQRANFVRHYVAEELLWRKAQKLELHKDPEIRRQLQSILKRVVVAKLIETEVMGDLEIAEEDLRSFHEANRARYDQPEQAKIAVIEVPSPDAAKKIQAELDAGKSFFDLAKAHSVHGATKDKGGVIDQWVGRGHPFLPGLAPGDAMGISEAIFATEPGKVTAPVNAGGRVFLFRVADRRLGKPRSFEEAQAEVARDYRTMKAQAGYQRIIEEQLQRGDVTLMEDAFAPQP